MEPLHSWVEYNAAKMVVDMLFSQYQHGKLSKYERKEMNELALRIGLFEKENEIDPYGKSNY